MEFRTVSTVSFAQKLWRNCRREAFASLHNPFVVGIASGTLPLSSFQHYIAQDCFFLSSFRESYEIALKCLERDIAAQAILQQQLYGVEEELKLHGKLAKVWGIDLSKYYQPSPATLSYTSFLTETAASSWNKSKLSFPVTSDGIFGAEIIAAMVPCMRLYAFLGQKLKEGVEATRTSDESRYTDWVKTYSSVEFENAAKELEDLLDRLSSPHNPGEAERMLQLYRKAMQLEHQFFSKQPMQPSYASSTLERINNSSQGTSNGLGVNVLLDFDLTCTVEDSCSPIAQLGLMSAVGDRETKEIIWSRLVESYSKDHDDIFAKVTNDTRGNRPQAIDELVAFMEDSAIFEKKANINVQNSGIFKGISKDSLREAGKKTVFQENCVDFLKVLLSKGVSLTVVSVCWSETFLEAAFSSQSLQGLKIKCNELEFDESGISNGNLNLRLQNAVDKSAYAEEVIINSSAIPWTIYVGDSVTDVLALLKADIGIIVGSSSSLRKICGRFGIDILPLIAASILLSPTSELDSKIDKSRLPLNTLYCAESWDEIEAFFCGINWEI